MKYVGRLALYCILFFLTLSVGYALLLSVVPVTITPLKIIRLLENAPEKGYRVDSKWRSVKNVSDEMVVAAIAAEDCLFLEHNGFDWDAIAKAIEKNKVRKRKVGASTISQQTAKNVFCYPDRTWVRKGFETYYTVLTELLWSKRRIMTVYLNVIETGHNIYGVQATAKRFYKKDASQLNRYEASMIAAVLPSPRRMNLAAPSSYMVRRAGAIRNAMIYVPPHPFP